HYEVVTLSRADKRKFRSEDTIDLHGHSRDVDRSLKVFCSRCIYNGVRCATVITGKGSGTVKQATLHWLRRNPGFIVGFFEITDSAGESGAIGVILRFLGKMDLGFM
ncbi:MAG: Smr/MutS family protein, partial [Holosporales bacterium]|nr:Smr/MutS family protein [Holosporales bacterium]